MKNTILLLVAHGSPSGEAIAQTEAFCGLFAENSAPPVELCYLELAQPDLAGGLRRAAEGAGQGGRVVAVPLFLGAADHHKNDLPAAIHWARQTYPQVSFACAAPFEPHAALITLLNIRVREALEAAAQSLEAAAPPLPIHESIVLVVGRGSSDPDSNSEVARTARLLFENRSYLGVEYAYQAVARPTIAEGVTRAARLGARQLIVAPYLLFTGWVENEIRAQASQTAGALNLPVIYARPLGVHPMLVDVAVERAAQALVGSAAMTCDVCKYRLPMAGYEQQVGQTPHSHHCDHEVHEH